MKIVYVSIIGLTLLVTLLLGFGALGLAVREGFVNEVGPVWFPPQSRYQIILRVGQDAQPWDLRRGRGTALNIWVHDRRQESWHMINLVRVPFGQSDQTQAYPARP